jgi:CRISPR-associated protein (TIGR02710 family)
MVQPEHVLIATVGMPVNPLAVAIAHHAPDGVIFIHSERSASTVVALQEHLDCWSHALLVEDEEDWDGAYQAAVEALHYALKRTPLRPRITAELTFGTKVMSAGLALALCGRGVQWSYTSGERDAAGMVMPTTEQVKVLDDPVESSLVRERQDFCLAWNGWRFESAALALERLLLKELTLAEFSFYKHLRGVVKGLSHWDRFDYRGALALLEAHIEAALASSSLWPDGEAGRILDALRYTAMPRLQRLAASLGRPSLELVQDLLANAQRRADSERFDDALSRYLRAVSLMIQIPVLVPPPAAGAPDEGLLDFKEDVEQGKLSKLILEVQNGLLHAGLQPVQERDYVTLESYLLGSYERLGFLPAEGWPKWRVL